MRVEEPRRDDPGPGLEGLEVVSPPGLMFWMFENPGTVVPESRSRRPEDRDYES